MIITFATKPDDIYDNIYMIISHKELCAEMERTINGRLDFVLAILIVKSEDVYNFAKFPSAPALSKFRNKLVLTIENDFMGMSSKSTKISIESHDENSRVE